MRKLVSLGLVIVAILNFVACDETTDTIGSTLIDNRDKLSVVADTFSVSTSTLTVDSVIARNITGYLGVVKDPETHNTITGNFMAQMNILSDFALLGEDSIAKDEGGKVIADSCELRLYYDTFYGDSLAQMKLTVMEMDKPLEEDKPIYSNYDPERLGYIRKGGINTSRTYTLADYTEDDSTRQEDDYTPNIRIKLNDPYTDKEGVTYNNYGTYILRQYYAHPENFQSPYKFLHNVMPGFYFKVTDGVGSMAYVFTAQINYYFRYITADSTYNYSSSFASTEEVLQATTFSNDNDLLEQMAGQTDRTYLKSPAGLFTEIALPVDNIMQGHENDTLNSVKLSLPLISDVSSTGYEISPSDYVLMIPKDSLETFFANNSLPNSRTSFLAAYSSSTNSYTFSNFAGIVSAMDKSDKVSADWNKVVIVPVSVTTQTTSQSTVITKVSHNMGMSSACLLGGSAGSAPLKLSVIYSKFQDK